MKATTEDVGCDYGCVPNRDCFLPSVQVKVRTARPKSGYGVIPSKSVTMAHLGAAAVASLSVSHHSVHKQTDSIWNQATIMQLP